MMFRFFIFLIGFGLAVAGGVTVVAYLNVITTGLTFIEYIVFISQKLECYLLIIGVGLISLSIFAPFDRK